MSEFQYEKKLIKYKLRMQSAFTALKILLQKTVSSSSSKLSKIHR